MMVSVPSGVGAKKVELETLYFPAVSAGGTSWVYTSLPSFLRDPFSVFLWTAHAR